MSGLELHLAVDRWLRGCPDVDPHEGRQYKGNWERLHCSLLIPEPSLPSEYDTPPTESHSSHRKHERNLHLCVLVKWLTFFNFKTCMSKIYSLV